MSSLDRLAELRGEHKFEEDVPSVTHRTSLSASSSSVGSGAPSLAFTAISRYTKLNQCLEQIQGVGPQVRKLAESEKVATTAAERKRIQGELEKLMQTAAKSAQSARKELDESEKEDAKFVKENGQESAASQIRVNLHTKAVRDFALCMKQYQSELAGYEATIRKRSARTVKLVDPDLPEEKVDALVESGEASKFIQTKLLSPGMELRDTVASLEQRHVEIRRLEREVLQIAELFRDLAVLVDLQQESLDVIEKRILTTKKNVEVGEVNIQKASRWQDKARKYRCCLCLLLLAILAAILAPVLYQKFKKS